jgi:small subunit ribosomal protein S3
VWIDLGDYSNEETADGSHAKAGQASKKPKRAYKR